MTIIEREKTLQQYYEKIGAQEDDTLTAYDYNLRNLEIDCAKAYMSSEKSVLDIGSGPGLACFEYAKLSKSVIGCDYALSMVDFATKTLHEKHSELLPKVTFEQGSALEMKYEDNKFDVITSHRVLIALLSWEHQQKALSEIVRCLKPGGHYLMFEACEEGLVILNKYRRMFGLEIVEEGGTGDYDRLLFSEKNLYEEMKKECDLITVHSFGMYYFLSRILQPLFVAPDAPHYDHKLNDVAFEIAKKIPDFENIGHLKGYVFRKKV